MRFLALRFPVQQLFEFGKSRAFRFETHGPLVDWLVRLSGALFCVNCPQQTSCSISCLHADASSPIYGAATLQRCRKLF